jgi:tRNA-dihydrouridine synthase
LGQIAHALYGTPAPVEPTGSALADLVAEHYEAILSFYGVALGLKVARKHLGWYADRAGAPKAEMLTADDAATVLRLIPSAFTSPERQAA